jgi:foldase protein PrsA
MARLGRFERWACGLSLGLTVLSATPAMAQGLFNKAKKADTVPAAKPAAREAAPPATIGIERRMVDPNEPIAVINGEPITRQQLADECVARRGEEILETLIARKLIDQAIRAAKVEVTPKEIDEEIERIAAGFGVSRDAWLRSLATERKISPAQYTRDIIFPALALKKLATPHVQVTEKDVQEALEGQFGDKLRCRMIMFNNLSLAKQAWSELSKNPGLFEQMARTKSIDPSTASMGGLLPDAIARHAAPQNVSDAAFEQLVDGPKGPDGKPSTKEEEKPKDGALSAIIQITDVTWVILRREGLIPATEVPTDPLLRKQAQARIFEQKIQEKIGEIYTDMMQKSSIENLLTAQVKPDQKTEEAQAPKLTDKDVKLMSNPGATPAPTPAGTPAAAAPRAETPGTATLAPPVAPAAAARPAGPPVGVSAADAKRASADFGKKQP